MIVVPDTEILVASLVVGAVPSLEKVEPVGVLTVGAALAITCIESGESVPPGEQSAGGGAKTNDYA